MNATTSSTESAVEILNETHFEIASEGRTVRNTKLHVHYI